MSHLLLNLKMFDTFMFLKIENKNEFGNHVQHGFIYDNTLDDGTVGCIENNKYCSINFLCKNYYQFLFKNKNEKYFQIITLF